MKIKMLDTAALMDSFTDYANEYGDQKLIVEMKSWLQQKMGKHYEISCGMSDSNRNLLTELSHNCLELSNKVDLNDSSRRLGYIMALSDVMDLLLNKMREA